MIDYDTKKVKTEYVQEELKTSYKCPICEEDIAQDGAVMKCKSCDFKAWTVQAGVRLAKADIDDLFTNHITKVKRFNKKDGNGTFDAMLAIDFEKHGTRYVFPNKK